MKKVGNTIEWLRYGDAVILYAIAKAAPHNIGSDIVTLIPILRKEYESIVEQRIPHHRMVCFLQTATSDAVIEAAPEIHRRILKIDGNFKPHRTQHKTNSLLPPNFL